MKDSDFHLEYLAPSDWSQWDEFIRNSAQGTVFQTSCYINIVQNAFSRPAEIVIVRLKKEIAGGAVLYPRKRFGIRWCTAPYFIPYNGFILHNFDRSDFYYRRIRLQEKIISLLKKELQNRFFFCDLHQSPFIKDLRALTGGKWQFEPEYTAVIPLENESDLFRRVDRDQRRRIRNFENNNAWKLHHVQDEKVLYRLMKNSYFAHEMRPPLDSQSFNNFTSHLLKDDIAKVYGLSVEDRLITALLVIEDFPMVYAMFSGRETGKDASGAEIFLFWQVIQKYKEQGFKNFDLLGAMHPSISKVKLELGGQLLRSDHTRYFRFQWMQYFFHFYSRKARKRRKIN